MHVAHLGDQRVNGETRENESMRWEKGNLIQEGFLMFAMWTGGTAWEQTVCFFFRMGDSKGRRVDHSSSHPPLIGTARNDKGPQTFGCTCGRGSGS